MKRYLVLILSLAALGSAALAQDPAPLEASVERASESSRVAPDSPRASLVAYLDAARSGQWERAARYLELSADQKKEGPRLAERLKAVLDRRLWFDLEKISADPSGRRDDDLPGDLEDVGTIPTGENRSQPVRLVRARDGEGAYWAFSSATVREIEALYSGLEDRWIRDRLTSAGLGSLLLPGPREILWWQWMALPLLLFLAWGLGRLLGLATRSVLGRFLARTRADWDDRLLVRTAPALTLAWSLGAFSVGLPFLGLTLPAQKLLLSVVSAGVVIAIFWALWRSLDVLVEVLLRTRWALESPSARNVLAISSNLGKAGVAAAGALATLASFGYPVATILAGLGIGGLAFAFGAQKTVENLFGSLALAADQPFRVGDFVKVGDFVGTVESIGLRSTRFRTLDRTVISIPNGIVADMRLESFAARDRMRLATTIGVLYGTTHDQMAQVLAGFERVLRQHPRIWPDAMVVKFMGFGASSLDIEIMAWFEVPTWADFQACRQEVLLGFMTVVEEAGTDFAFPTRTVHLVSGSERQAPPSGETAD